MIKQFCQGLCINSESVRPEVFTAEEIWIAVFWVKKPFNLIGGYPDDGGNIPLHNVDIYITPHYVIQNTTIQTLNFSLMYLCYDVQHELNLLICAMQNMLLLYTYSLLDMHSFPSHNLTSSTAAHLH